MVDGKTLKPIGQQDDRFLYDLGDGTGAIVEHGQMLGHAPLDSLLARGPWDKPAADAPKWSFGS